MFYLIKPRNAVLTMICRGYIQADIAVNVGTLFYNCYYQIRGSENWKYFGRKGGTLFKYNV
jgi:hypothetical protein